MTTPVPDSDEARQALHSVRQQQANLIQASGYYRPMPVWRWLAVSVPAMALVGLWMDLRGPAQWALLTAIIAALLVYSWAGRRRAKVRVRTTWWFRQYDNRTYWTWSLYIAVPVLVLLLAGSIFMHAGLPWPHTLSGAIAGVVTGIGARLVSPVIRRRLIAHAESGSDETLHGLPRLLSLLPVFEALEQRRDRAAASRRGRRATRDSQ